MPSPEPFQPIVLAEIPPTVTFFGTCLVSVESGSRVEPALIPAPGVRMERIPIRARLPMHIGFEAGTERRCSLELSCELLSSNLTNGPNSAWALTTIGSPASIEAPEPMRALVNLSPSAFGGQEFDRRGSGV